MADAFFGNWSGIWRVLLIGPLAYVALIVILRTTGKRTLSKLNAFDLVVTVALGSTLAAVITSKDLPLAEGVLALALLITFQLIVTFLSVRWPWFDRLTKSEPTLLLRTGKPLRNAMMRERITEDELRAAVRQAGSENLNEAEAVFLESDGSLTAILSKEHA